MDVNMMEVEIWICRGKVLLEELHLVPTDFKSMVCAVLREDVPQRERNTPQAAADLENVAVAPDMAVDAKEHAPLLGPAEPLFQSVDPFALDRRNQLGLVGESRTLPPSQKPEPAFQAKSSPRPTCPLTRKAESLRHHLSSVCTL